MMTVSVIRLMVMNLRWTRTDRFSTSLSRASGLGKLTRHGQARWTVSVQSRPLPHPEQQRLPDFPSAFKNCCKIMVLTFYLPSNLHKTICSAKFRDFLTIRLSSGRIKPHSAEKLQPKLGFRDNRAVSTSYFVIIVYFYHCIMRLQYLKPMLITPKTTTSICRLAQ